MNFINQTEFMKMQLPVLNKEFERIVATEFLKQIF